MSATITTPLGLHAVIQYRQPSNRVQVRGTILGRVYTNDRPWLVVRRVKDAATVVVGLHEVVTVVTPAPDADAMLPVFDAVGPATSTPPEVPVIVPQDHDAPEGPRMVVVPAPPVVVSVPVPCDAGIDDRVRYLSPYGVVKVGIVVEIDTVSALIEVGARGDLELVDVSDIHAVLAA